MRLTKGSKQTGGAAHGEGDEARADHLRDEVDGRGGDRRASKHEGRQHQTVLSMAATMCWVKLRAKGSRDKRCSLQSASRWQRRTTIGSQNHSGSQYWRTSPLRSRQIR